MATVGVATVAQVLPAALVGKAVQVIRAAVADQLAQAARVALADYLALAALARTTTTIMTTTATTAPQTGNLTIQKVGSADSFFWGLTESRESAILCLSGQLPT